MYIIAIAWLYVTVLMAATEKTITAGLLTFIFYGLLPCALLLWILGVKHRRHKKIAKQRTKHLGDDDMHQPDSSHTEANE
ncbi:MAG TPA: hypothetical protein VES38_11855 [Methylotenera sp.]|nr:hypothetical protein [Methylotenera sp.]